MNIPQVVIDEDEDEVSSTVLSCSVLLTELQDDGRHVLADHYDERSRQTRLLATYLWENYIE